MSLADQYDGGTFWGVFSEAQLAFPAKDDPNQMKLGAQAPANEEVKGDVCGASDGHGGTCILKPFHDGEGHTFSDAKPVDLSEKKDNAKVH